MTHSGHGFERVERRVLGALRCVDATTGVPIERPLQVSVATQAGAGAGLLRNRSGLYVITTAPGLQEHTHAFLEPPGGAPALPLLARLSDPSGGYLPRSARFRLPRDADASHADEEASLFRPIDIALYPSTTARTGANWALLRVSVSESGGDLLGGALLRVTRAAVVLARGLSDWRGEALLAVPGVPMTTWSDSPAAVVVGELGVQVQALFDPATGSRSSAARVAAALAPAAAVVVDPQALEDAADALPHTTISTAIAAHREQQLSITLTLP